MPTRDRPRFTENNQNSNDANENSRCPVKYIGFFIRYLEAMGAPVTSSCIKLE